MPNVALRCKVSRKTGMGHLVRQSHLANKLKSMGWKVTLYPDRYAPALERLRSEQLDFVPVKNNEEFLKQLTPVDLIVLDIQNTQAGWMKELRKKTNCVAGFEDLGRGRHFLDLLIDCNLEEGKAGDLSRNVKPLLGLKHCLLNPEFSRYSEEIRKFEKGIESILVTMGGTDPNDLTSKITMAMISDDYNFDKFFSTNTLNIDKAFPSDCFSPKITLLHPQYDLLDIFYCLPNVKYLPLTPDMPQMLASHDVVICSGGVTMHEAMAVGTPAFVIAQVDTQTKLARFAEQQGAVKYLGQAGNWNPEDVKNILDTPLEKLKAMSDAGKATIDGKGMDRVVDALKSLIPF